MPAPLDFIHALTWHDIPAPVRAQIELSLLDLIGVAAGGRQTRLAQLICDHATSEFGGDIPILFDGRPASASGAALAAGMTIDALDGHDGFNPAKGHIGCPLLPSALMLGHQANISGRDFLAAMVMGYEFGARAAIAQHATVPDYHTSGSWGAVTAAAAGARLLDLTPDQTRHALGIAEYHGPRSQMMRCIDHPTMVKDGSGWGAMAGVSAVKLAQSGFTGAPAITVEDTPDFWSDLGTRWYMLEQYYKPYPVCRWAQAPIESALAVQAAHGLNAADITLIEIETFHESVRLANPHPTSTEAAQYSTCFPVAIALQNGTVTARDIADEALNRPETARLASAIRMVESDHANAHFPTKRLARVTLETAQGRFSGDWSEPRWDHTSPATAAELRAKYHGLADPILGRDTADRIEESLSGLEEMPLRALSDQLLRPINP
ncbi:MmgE/PrpD family protein [Shimia abyssi]|uniref:2-methylcitrate dehydratase PrpD n=1 Tax=Shimia abyssi TaxID=1662395 RepID=A0A2P8FJJ4_9RHOB|nr:MmgE/PrpD family protein [Shimia abyssi]PSL21875.1 2-methylcitrate dehydratase PrpD [Shimia abyssi]